MTNKMNLLLLILFFACTGKKEGQQVTGDKRQTVTNTQQTESVNKHTSSDNTLLGEWGQAYAVLDQNGNTLLDPEERNGTRSTMGINYFQFNGDGSCLYDSDMKFKGTYEVSEKNGKKNLKVTVNGFGETYHYTIVEPVTDELTLYATGAFMIYKKK